MVGDDDPDYEPMLYPFAPIDEDATLNGVFIFRPSRAALAAQLVGVEYDPTRGAVAFDARTDSGYPGALTGLEFAVVDADGAEPLYFGEDGLPDPDLEGLTSARQGGALNVGPGLRQVQFFPDQGACEAGDLGRPVDEPPNTIEMRVEPGYLTVFAAWCPGAGVEPDECDILEQDCESGEASKCRAHLYIDTNGEDAWGTECVEEGDAALDETCERFDGDAGNDDCAAGLYCANLGLPPGTGRTCRTHCLGNADCGEGQVCHGMGDVGGATVGVCLDGCDPFAEDDGCADGNSCVIHTNKTPDQTEAHGICVLHGEVEVGGDCSAALCGPNLTCTTNDDGRVCTVSCTDENPCEVGECVP